MMAVCSLTGEKLPDRNSHFSGFECNVKNSYKCGNKREHFKDGSNCYLCQRPFDKDKIDSIWSNNFNIENNNSISDGGK